MANVSSVNLPKRIASSYNKLFWLTVKLHNASASIGFIKKCLHLHITPKFAKVHGQFIEDNEKHNAERSVLCSHLRRHISTLNDLTTSHRDASQELLSITGGVIFNLLLKKINITSRTLRLSSFQTKNKKLLLLRRTYNNNHKLYDIPVINLSSVELTKKELWQLSYGLDHSFVDKNKHVKKTIASSFESLAQSIDNTVSNEERENLHEFLRAYCDIFTKNVYSSKDFTYSNLSRLIRNKTIAIIPGDKDPCVIVMDKADYIQKIQDMIDEGINKGVYKKTEDKTLHELKNFKAFIYRNFKKYEHYEKMCAPSNTPAQLYGTAKTHKFDNISNITVESLKFRPIIAQTGTCMYNAAQVISEYLKPLYVGNEYIIHNTQDFARLIQSQPPLEHNEEYASYDVESLFTNVPVKETIEYILEEIYKNKRLPKICTRLILKRLLLKLTTESTFVFQSTYYKQTDGCTMGGPLSVTFSNIYLTKLELDKVKPTKPKFYKRFVDDVITRRRTDQPDLLLEEINKYHPNIKFTVESNPSKFLDTNITTNTDNKISTSVHRKVNKLPSHWTSQVPKRYKRNAINGDLNRSYRIGQDFNYEKGKIMSKFTRAGFPVRFTNSVFEQFENKLKSTDSDSDLIIPKFLFEEPKKFILIDIPFCESNETLAKRFLNKLNIFTKNQIDFAIKWSTKKVKQLFRLKDTNRYPACKIYEGNCSCNKNYIGETKRNVQTRWNEHDDPRNDSEPAKHLREFPDHHFQWKVIMNAPSNRQKRKNLEAALIALKRPSLNDQLDSNKLILFRNGVT